MAAAMILRASRYLGLSTDTKPIDCDVGSTFFEFNTGYMFIWNGYAWVPKSYMPETTVNYKQVSLHHTDPAGDKTVDVMTATAQDLFIDAVIIHVPDDLSEVATFTGLSVQTDDDTPLVIMSTTDGAKAKLTGDFYHVYRGPVVTAATKKIQLTIKAATAGSGKVADVTVLWRPVVAGGYYLNA